MRLNARACDAFESLFLSVYNSFLQNYCPVEYSSGYVAVEGYMNSSESVR